MGSEFLCWGGKLTGKMSALSIGALNVQTEEEGDIGSNNFTVVRLRYDLFSRSNVGAIEPTAPGMEVSIGPRASIPVWFSSITSFLMDFS